MAGALASTAFVLGGGGVASATEGVAAGQDAEAQQPQEGLVFAYDYWPLTPFLVINQLQTSTTVDILNGIDDEGIPEISQPDDFNGYVVNYRMNDDGPGLYTAVFTEASLQTDERYQFSGEAQMFSTQLNLLEGTIESANGDGDAGDDETEAEPTTAETEAEETTTEQSETQEVVVGTTTQTEG